MIGFYWKKNVLNLKSVSVWSHLVNELPFAISWTRCLGPSVSISCSFVDVYTLRMCTQVFAKFGVSVCCAVCWANAHHHRLSLQLRSRCQKCCRETLNLQRSRPDAKCVSALYGDKFIISNKLILFDINLFDKLTFHCCREHKSIWHKAKTGRRCIHCPPFFTVPKEQKIDT